MSGEAFVDYYELLQVSANADEDTIHRVFRHLAKKHHPDAILMDVNMPMMDGLHAFKQLRSDPQTASIPVVFVSEVQSHLIYPVVEASPRAAHLKKPIDLDELSSFLRQFLERYKS